jgi:hypothetical protein
VRGEVLDDVALLRAIKRGGGRASSSTAPPGDLPDVRGLAGAARGLHEVAVVGVRVAAGRGRRGRGLAVCYVVPPLAALRGSLTGLGGYVAAVVGRYAVAERTGGRSLPDSLGAPGVGRRASAG